MLIADGTVNNRNIMGLFMAIPSLTLTPTILPLTDEQAVGHADHWSCLTSRISDDVPTWLKNHIDSAKIAHGLVHAHSHSDVLLLSGNESIHLNQILSLTNDGKPKSFINAFPCVNSPYGQWAIIDSILCCDAHQEAILRLKTDDGTILYAFDQLYAVNKAYYQKDTRYFVNLSAFAYSVTPSNKSEVIVVDEPEAIRYHRAFNDILTKHAGKPPIDLEEQIAKWQPEPNDLPLQPIEINVGHMCAYLFGDTIGQQDEAWCQGQIIGKQTTIFNQIAITLLDVVILRESLDNPVVIRLAVNNQSIAKNIEVNDYIQANIWLQASIYQENQLTKS